MSGNITNKIQEYNLKAIDIARFILSFMVVSLHTLPFYQCQELFLCKVWWMIAQSAVPIFFIMSGFFIFYHVKAGKADMEGKYLRKVAIRYCKIYAIWSLAYLPMAVIYYVQSGFTPKEGLIAYVRDFFYTGQHYNSWILWYILSSIYAFVVISLIFRIWKSKAYLLIGLLSVSALVAYVALHLQSGRTDIISPVRLLYGMIYIPIGILIGKNSESIEKNKLMFYFIGLTCFVISVALQWFDVPRMAQDTLMVGIAGCAFVWLIFIKMRLRISTVGYRKMSGTIYYIHLYVWTIYYWFMYKEKHFGMDSFIVTSIVCFIISFWSNMKYQKNRDRD